MAKSLYAMATNAFQMKNFTDAVNHLSQLNELLNILKKGYLKGSMHLLWGNALRELGDYTNSLPQYDLAMKLLHSKRCWNMHNYEIGRAHV